MKYLGEKHKTSRTTTKLRDNQPVTTTLEFNNSCWKLPRAHKTIRFLNKFLFPRRTSYNMAFKLKDVAEAEAVENNSEITRDLRD